MGSEEVKPIETMSYEELQAELDVLKTTPEEPEGTPPTEESAPEGTETKAESTEAPPAAPAAPEGFNFDDSEYKAKGWNDDQIGLLKKKEEQLWHKQKMIERQEAEVAASRKKENEIQLREAEVQKKLAELAQTREETKENFYSDPTAYNKAVADEYEVQKQLKDIQAQKQSLETQKLIYSRIPEFESLIGSEIPEIIKEDAAKAGMSPSEIDQLVSQFKTQWTTADPKDLLLIGEKAKMRSELNRYKAKLAEVSKTPDDVGKRIAQVANQRPTVNSAGAPAMKPLDPYEMTEEQINAELAMLK